MSQTFERYVTGHLVLVGGEWVRGLKGIPVTLCFPVHEDSRIRFCEREWRGPAGPEKAELVDVFELYVLTGDYEVVSRHIVEARCETCRHWGGNLEGLELPDDTGRRICLRATMSGVVSKYMRVNREGEEWVREHNDGEDGPETYTWDEGIAP